ncbi:L-lactate dehydrogenase complex protein LldF [bacterium A37T11]|nr:L-lactate dehydrogenase complex protein LldF [bacterium A37T11]
MSSAHSEEFLSASAQKAFVPEHRQIMDYNIAQYNKAVAAALPGFANLEQLKRKAHLLKWKVIENLDKLLPDFEANFLKNGGKVIWANDAAEARDEINKILKKANARTVVKSKSMVTEEIGVDKFLQEQRIEVLASDILREKYLQADAGITGANFLIADTGSIALTENEGNVRFCTTFPRIHIAIAGIEKLIASLADLAIFWPLLATHGSGQQLTVYNSILSGPRKQDETDGPEEMYVILLDNGRTDLLAQKDQRQGLYCIRCGACLNACPVYKHIGSNAFGTTYGGPIGSLITPHQQGMEEFIHLSQASSLCGKCTEVCPVKIDIQHMLLMNRRDAVQQNLSSKTEQWFWKIFSKMVSKRLWMDLMGGKMKNWLIGAFFKKHWGTHRKLPHVAKKSFSKQYRKKV